MRTIDSRSAGLSTLTKIFYGVGGMTDSIKAGASGLYLLFFYTTVRGLPARLVGIAAALGLLWDAIIDPAIGRLSDRTSGRFGRRHGWMLTGAIGMAASFFGLFAPPGGLSTAQLFGWLLLLSFLLRTSHSMFTVPYLALGAELMPDYDERTKIAGYRAVAAQFGAIAASGLTQLVFFPGATGPRSRLDASSYTHMAISLGLLLGVAALVASLGTWGHGSIGTVRARPNAFKWGQLLRNRAFLVLMGSAALFVLAAVINVSLSIYFLTAYAGIQSGTVLALSQFALHGGAIAGVAVWARAAMSRDKHVLQAISCWLTGGLVLAAFWVGRGGSLLGAAFVPLIVFGNACAGAVGSGVPVLSASMLADVADEHELHSGQRSEGAFFGAFSCVLQFATGLAVAVAGLLVDYFAGMVPGAPTQAPLTVTRIGVLASFLPGTLMLMAGLVVLPYHLTRDRARAIHAALAEVIEPAAGGVR